MTASVLKKNFLNIVFLIQTYEKFKRTLFYFLDIKHAEHPKQHNKTAHPKADECPTSYNVLLLFKYYFVVEKGAYFDN